MRLILTVVISLFFLPYSSSADEAPRERFVISNVNIVEVDAKRITPVAAVVVHNGFIERILFHEDADGFDDAASFDGVEVIDGRDGFLTPGLIDMHVHMYEPAAYTIAMSHGVTHVRIMNGIPAQLAWRDQVNDGVIMGSSSTVSSPIISGYLDAPLQHGVINAQEAREAVRQYHRAGYDLIKAYGNLPEDALAALLDEAALLEMPVAKHGPHGSGRVSIEQMGVLQSFEHVEDIYQGVLDYQFDSSQLDGISQALEATQIPVTPTLNIFYQLTQLSQEKASFLASIPVEYTSDIIALEAKTNQVDRWLNASENMANHNQKTMEFLMLVTQSLNENGVELLVGSDSGVLLSPHGLATHNEIRLLQEAGLDSYSALAAATTNAARALSREREMARIAPGYMADFIYTLEDPIEDLSILVEPAAVVKSGNWYSRAELEQVRSEAISNRSLWEEMVSLMEAW